MLHPQLWRGNYIRSCLDSGKGSGWPHPCESREGGWYASDVRREEIRVASSYPWHWHMPQDYIRASNIKAYKKQKLDEMASTSRDSPAAVLRPRTPTFSIKEDCLYCGQRLRDYSIERKVPLHRRERSHEAMTMESLQSVIIKSEERGDEWGESVKRRISNEYDLVTAEVRYHHDCQIIFYAGKPCPNEENVDGEQRPGRPADTKKQQAFERLCQHIAYLTTTNANMH